MQLPVNYNDIPYTLRRTIREEYARIQGGLCCHCGNPLEGKPADEVLAKGINTRLFPDNFFKHPVHLHHNHDSGMTIGAVHAYCNAVLWQHYGE